MRLVRCRSWLPLAALLGLCHPAGSTDRFYRDLTARSGDGKLRLEVKSPDNVNAKDRPFARHFVYTLSEVATGRLLWQRKQGRREGPPVQAFVHDGGWVVVGTGHDELLLLNPRGVVTLNLHILREGLPAAEVKEHVQKSTAGPIWADYSHWYFFVSGGQPYFAVRTWWDRRIVLSLPRAKQVPDAGAVRRAADAAERAFVLATLRAGARVARAWAARRLPEYSSRDKGPWDELEHLLGAVHLAGRIRLKEAGPLLLELERIPSFGTSVFADETVPDGALFVATSRYDRMRQQVQLALRRLGEKPAGYPVRELMLKHAGAEGEKPYHPARHVAPRAERVRSVRKGLAPKGVVDVVGEPDYVVRPCAADGDADWVWEYDVDADPPYTLRIVWAGQRMRSVKKVKPPVWKDRKTRDTQH